MSYILGIDPGLASLGWGIIDEVARGRYQFIDCGRIITEQHKDVSPLDDLYRRLGELRVKFYMIESNNILSGVAFEAFTLYGHQDQGAFIQMANVTGMIDTLFARYHPAHYLPQHVKLTVACNRNAKKPEVKRAVCRILNWEPKGRTNDHAIDALAVAICHGQVAMR